MRTLELWRRRVRDMRGKLITTRAHLSADEAKARDPCATPVQGTLELHEVPESAAEFARALPGTTEGDRWRVFYFTSHKGSALDVMQMDGIK